jgi:hypothetical protein
MAPLPNDTTTTSASGVDPDVEAFQRKRAERRAQLAREEAEEAEKFRRAMAVKAEKERLAKEAAAKAERERLAKEKAADAVRKRREQEKEAEEERLEEERKQKVAGKVSGQSVVTFVLTGSQRKAPSHSESGSEVEEIEAPAPKVSVVFSWKFRLTSGNLEN